MRRFLPCLFASVCIALLLEQARPAAPPVPNLVRLTRDGGIKQNLHFSPDGSHLILTRIHKGIMGLWTMKSDGSDLKSLLVPAPNSVHCDAHYAPDGKRVAYVHVQHQGTDGKLQINTCASDGKDVKVLIPHKAFDESPRFSPDGKRLVWVSTRDKNQELYSCAADGSDIKRLTNDSAPDNAPSWSPDGKRIAFASGRSGNFEIHTMSADGTEVKRMTNHSAMDTWPAWSPDGARIAFTSNRDGNYEIYVMNADGSNVKNLTQHKGQDNFAAWSPDGKRIAFISNRTGGQDVYVMGVD